MQEPAKPTANEPSLPIRLLFCGSFFLPALYLVCFQLPFDEAEAQTSTFRTVLGYGLVGTLIGSLLIPLATTLRFAQTRVSKLGLCIFCCVAWLVVQFCAALAIGFVSLMYSGFEGIQQ